MANSMGEAIREGTTLGYFEYGGTTDSLWSRKLRATEDEVSEHWRKQEDDDFDECSCGKPPIVVMLFQGGVFWPGAVCLDCKKVLGRCSPYDYAKESRSDWWHGRPWAQTDEDRAKDKEGEKWGVPSWEKWWAEHRSDTTIPE